MTNDPRVTGASGMHRFTGGKGMSPGSWTPTSGGDPDGDADDAAELRDIAADLEAKTGKPGGDVEKDWEEIDQLGGDIEDSGEGSWDDAMDAEALKRGYKSWDHLNKLRSERIAAARRTQSFEKEYGVSGEEYELPSGVRENKLTKSSLKQLIKEEIEKARLHDKPASREGTPPWYSAPGGVADRIQEMAKEIRGELDKVDTRLNALEGDK